MTKKHYTVEEIARLLGAEFIGDPNHQVSGLASLETAQSSDVSFLSNLKLKSQLDTTQAGCVLLSESVKDSTISNAVILDDPYLGFARIAQLLDSTPVPKAEIHPGAIVSVNAVIADGVSIGPGCVIEDAVEIDEGVIIGPNSVIGSGAKIGKNTRLFANVSIYHQVKIGKDCIVQAGAVIGSDGFGYANDKGVWVRIPQTGAVDIGNHVDIGANACIDRGALNDTIIGNGVKIDNLCHIAHNVEIGENTAMAGFTGIAGSAKIGKHCTFSGRSSILGHLFIADGTHVTACSLINRSNKEAGVFSSGTGMQDNKTWRKNVARFRQLDDMAKQLKKLQKMLEQLQSGS